MYINLLFHSMTNSIMSPSQNGSETCHGEGFREAVKAVVTEAREGGRDGHQIVAVGVNCSDPTHIQVKTASNLVFLPLTSTTVCRLFFVQLNLFL